MQKLVVLLAVVLPIAVAQDLGANIIGQRVRPSLLSLSLDLEEQPQDTEPAHTKTAAQLITESVAQAAEDADQGANHHAHAHTQTHTHAHAHAVAKKHAEQEDNELSTSKIAALSHAESSLAHLPALVPAMAAAAPMPGKPQSHALEEMFPLADFHRTLHLTGANSPLGDPAATTHSIIMSPSFGPTSGGVWVQVVGAGSFYTPNSLQCKLDLVEQYCYSNHHFYTWCYMTPKCAGVYPVTCHNGPLKFEGKYAVIAKVPWVTSLYPFSGDISGGTPVTVRGWNFEPHCPHNLLCRFGTQIVRAKYYTSSSIMCIAPCGLQSNSFVSVEVSNDGGHHWSMSGVQYGYVGSSLNDDQMQECTRYLATGLAADIEVVNSQSLHSSDLSR